MKTIMNLLSTLFLTVLLSPAAFATIGGTWLNVDANTRGLTKAVIPANESYIHVWGSCSPTDCDWKRTRMLKSGNKYYASYDQGFATRRLEIVKLQDGRLCIIVNSKYKDSRPDRTDRYFFKRKLVPHRPIVVAKPKPVIKEDCVRIDPRTAKVRLINGRYKIVDGPQGNHLAFDFGNKKAEAYRALHLIQCYQITQSCFVGRPGPSFKYLLVNNLAPKGPVKGEDCVSFDPNKIQVKYINNRYKIVEGNHWIFDFENKKAEAYQALAIIKKHGFTKSCYVGRPNPSFEYLRK